MTLGFPGKFFLSLTQGTNEKLLSLSIAVTDVFEYRDGHHKSQNKGVNDPITSHSYTLTILTELFELTKTVAYC